MLVSVLHNLIATVQHKLIVMTRHDMLVIAQRIERHYGEPK
jgi:hypothetical protein